MIHFNFFKPFLYRFLSNNILKRIAVIKRLNFILIYHRLCNINFADNEFVEHSDIKQLKETAMYCLMFLLKETNRNLYKSSDLPTTNRNLITLVCILS